MPNSSSYTSSQGGAIYNTNKIGTISGTFSGNYSSAYKTYGGAIYNSFTITEIKNSNFVGNYTLSKTSTNYGGAINTTTDLNITADNGTSKFSGNYTQVNSNTKNAEAIYVSNSSATLKLEAKNGGTI